MRLSRKQLNIKATELGIVCAEDIPRAELVNKISYRSRSPCKKGKVLDAGRCKALPFKSTLVEYAIYYDIETDLPRLEMIEEIKEASADIGDAVADQFDSPETFPEFHDAVEMGLLEIYYEPEPLDEDPPPSILYAELKKAIDEDIERDPRLKEPGYIFLSVQEGLDRDLFLLSKMNMDDLTNEDVTELERLVKAGARIPVSNASDVMSVTKRIMQRSKNYEAGLRAYAKLGGYV